MRMPESLTEALNRQVALELESSNVYLQMSAYLAERSLTGMASWMRVQAEEERVHALKLLDFVLDRGNAARLGVIPAPRFEYADAAEVFRAALAHEQRVSQAISDLYVAATTLGDATSLPLLQWFLTEQVEEEATVAAIVDQLELIAGDGGALLLLDRELGARTVAPVV